MTFDEYAQTVLGRTVSQYIANIDSERDEDGHLTMDASDVQAQLLDAFSDAFSMADSNERLDLLRHGARSFERLVLEVQRRLGALPYCRESDREQHEREAAPRGRLRIGRDSIAWFER